MGLPKKKLTAFFGASNIASMGVVVVGQVVVACDMAIWLELIKVGLLWGKMEFEEPSHTWIFQVCKISAFGR